MTVEAVKPVAAPGFDVAKLDALLEAAGIDALIATSRHNVRYVAGHYSAFFTANTAVGEDSFLEAAACVRGRLDQAFLVASPQEAGELALAPPWLPTIDLVGFTTVDTARAAARNLAERGLERGTIGIEEPFVPLRFQLELSRALPHATLVDVTPVLSQLRVVKRPDERELLRTASDKVVDAMHATMTGVSTGATTLEIYDRFAAEQVARGLTFEFCAMGTGTNPFRAPSSEHRWEPGAVLSLDSGGSIDGYYADLTRMAVRGEPTARMRELLDQVRAVHDAARSALRPGATGREVLETTFAAAKELPDTQTISETANPGTVSFNIHGVGLVRHEPPRIDVGGGSVSDHPPRLDEPLEAGTVLSIDMILPTPDVGLVKLEDMVAITEDGYEAYGDAHRDWIVGG
jgi:Xaa-Pro aminopeptidase